MLARWRERDVFAESLRRRRDAPPWGFYEGPPTANGAPGTHHVLSRVFKDIFPRYRTMRGHYVERKGGWDCHGLPVELAVEAELGMQSKEDIERFGIAEFNARCREKVLSHVEDWNRLTERIGFWIDLDDAYRTLDADYIESVWWALEQIHAQGLLYEKLKVVPYCIRCGTALSSHELGQPDVYRDVIDPSVYVRLPVIGARGAAQQGDELIVWTTTPWTLVSNAAVAVDPELDLRARPRRGRPGRDRRRVAGGARARRGRRGTRALPGERARRRRLRPAVRIHHRQRVRREGTHGAPADFVTDRDGTGLVHTAIAFGEDDFRLGEQQGLNVINPVRLDGTYDERIGPYEGRWVKDADPDLIEDLRARGRLLRVGVLRALLSALLALPHAAALLRQAVLVHRYQRAQGPAAGRQRDRQLAPRARQARALRQLAGGQRRLGAVARALLGDAAASVALRQRPRPGDRLVRHAAGAVGGRARAIRIARSSTR